MMWRQNNFAFARRLPVRWSAPSWRAQIIALAPSPRVGAPDGSRRFLCSPRQVRIFRESSETRTHPLIRMTRNFKPTFLHLPRLRVNPSTTSL